MLDAYLQACQRANSRPMEELSSALSNHELDHTFRLTSLSLVRRRGPRTRLAPFPSASGSLPARAPRAE